MGISRCAYSQGGRARRFAGALQATKSEFNLKTPRKVLAPKAHGWAAFESAVVSDDALEDQVHLALARPIGLCVWAITQTPRKE